MRILFTVALGATLMAIVALMIFARPAVALDTEQTLRDLAAGTVQSGVTK